MSIYRRKFKSPEGKATRATTYTAEFRHHGALHRRGGFISREIAEQWVRAEQVRLQRGELGITKPMLAMDVKPLTDEFCEHLESKGLSAKYIYNVGQRLARLRNEAGWQTLGDVTIASIQDWIASKPKYRKRPISARTINQFVDTAREFGQWLKKPRRVLAVNPLDELERISATPNVFYRRSATIEEIQLLIGHASEDRRLFYVFLLYSPLRMRAAHHLLWDDLRLDIERPCVQVRAEIDKGRKGQQLPLRLDVAQMLRVAKSKARATGDDLVFPNPPTINDLRDDLKAAGVPFSDAKGNRRLDFHSFRRTLIRLLKQAGVQMDVAHHALGHADKRTTEKWYDDDLANAPITNAMEAIPALSPIRIAHGGRR